MVFIDVNLDINPTTGMPMIARKVAGSVSLYAPDGETNHLLMATPQTQKGNGRPSLQTASDKKKNTFVSNPDSLTAQPE